MMATSMMMMTKTMTKDANYKCRAQGENTSCIYQMTMTTVIGHDNDDHKYNDEYNHEYNDGNINNDDENNDEEDDDEGCKLQMQSAGWQRLLYISDDDWS